MSHARVPTGVRLKRPRSEKSLAASQLRNLRSELTSDAGDSNLFRRLSSAVQSLFCIDTLSENGVVQQVWWP